MQIEKKHTIMIPEKDSIYNLKMVLIPKISQEQK